MDEAAEELPLSYDPRDQPIGGVRVELASMREQGRTGCDDGGERSLEIVRDRAQKRTSHALGFGLQLRATDRARQLHSLDRGGQFARAGRKQESLLRALR